MAGVVGERQADVHEASALPLGVGEMRRTPLHETHPIDLDLGGGVGPLGVTVEDPRQLVQPPRDRVDAIARPGVGR